MTAERDLIDVSAFAEICAPASAQDCIDLILRTGFSPSAYRDSFGDLAEQGFNPTQALAHFFRHGLQEGRSVTMDLDLAACRTRVFI